MKSAIKAVWNGSFKDGVGQLEGEHSTLHDVQFKPVFAKNENTVITNPEELLGSAHATCFNLTLSYLLSQADISPEVLQTSAAISLKNNIITNSDLTLVAKIPGINNDQFQEYAKKAKEMCAVGNALNAEVSLNATLEI